jgi:CheY-like chemotaxis protein
MVKFKVLIVDDDYINRKLLIEILKNNLYKVDAIESVDGREAQMSLSANPDIQLVLLDIEMPNVNGIEFLNWYINDDTIHQTPIIAISSNDERKSEALIRGANAFLVKPISEEKLLEAIISASN